MAPSFDNLPEDDNYEDEEEIDFSGIYYSIISCARLMAPPRSPRTV